MEQDNPGSANSEQSAGNRKPCVSPVNGVTIPDRKRWQKGQSGNPGGRPTTMTRAAKRVLASQKDEHGRSQVAYDIMAAQVAKALEGDTAAAKFFTETVQGKPVTPTEHSVAHGGTVKLIVKGSSADDGWSGRDSL